LPTARSRTHSTPAPTLCRAHPRRVVDTPADPQHSTRATRPRYSLPRLLHAALLSLSRSHDARTVVVFAHHASAPLHGSCRSRRTVTATSAKSNGIGAAGLCTVTSTARNGHTVSNSSPTLPANASIRLYGLPPTIVAIRSAISPSG